MFRRHPATGLCRRWIGYSMPRPSPHYLRPRHHARSRAELLSRYPRRQFSTCPPLSSVRDVLSFFPAALVPPVVFVGLAVTLWAYKCVMMVVFQNKIIYMPSMPPFSRSEKIDDYAGVCRPVEWEEKRIRAADGTGLALCVGGIKSSTARRRHVIVLYFQGNGSSTPPRLPLLSNVLKKLETTEAAARYTLIALSYRGFWTSRGRPSQRGIELDAIAALNWLQDAYLEPGAENHTSVVLWGQSIGAGVATGLLAHHSEQLKSKKVIEGLILETPFLSIKSMLLAMYPQRWLPYRYLWPFLRNWWDSEDALRRIGRGLQTNNSSSEWARRLRILIVSAANDELVPAGQAEILEKICKDAGLTDVARLEVSSALHNDASARSEGQNAIVGFLRRVGES